MTDWPDWQTAVSTAKERAAAMALIHGGSQYVGVTSGGYVRAKLFEVSRDVIWEFISLTIGLPTTTLTDTETISSLEFEGSLDVYDGDGHRITVINLNGGSFINFDPGVFLPAGSTVYADCYNRSPYTVSMDYTFFWRDL